jgi:hypothetical protein
MAGILPNEGEHLVAQMVLMNVDTDRGTDLELGLFTNTTAPETITAATLTEPTGGSYARKTLTDGSWTVTNDTGTYAAQTFTATGSAYAGSIYGYFIVTKGTTPRIIDIEVDNAGPYTMAQNDTYTITPTVTVA